MSKALREDNMVCPVCKAPDQSVDLLVPNHRLRDRVDRYLRQQAGAGATNGSAGGAKTGDSGQPGRRIATVTDGREDATGTGPVSPRGQSDGPDTHRPLLSAEPSSRSDVLGRSRGCSCMDRSSKDG